MLTVAQLATVRERDPYLNETLDLIGSWRRLDSTPTGEPKPQQPESFKFPINQAARRSEQSPSNKDQPPNVCQKKWPPVVKAARYIRCWTVCIGSHCDWRRMICNTLPLSAGHLHPGMGPTLVYLERLSRCINALTFEVSRRDDRIAKYR
jgi:hypothetical protein